jgi:carboxyl-terminal processing protease
MVRFLICSAICSAAVLAQKPAKPDYPADVRFAVQEIETRCAALLKRKGIDWRKAADPLVKEAAKVATDAEHAVLLARLLARLRDGHAAVQPTEKTKDLAVDDPPRAGPGFFVCRSGSKILIKNPDDAEGKDGFRPGAEVVSIDGKPALAWLEARAKALADRVSFSTDAQAFYFACHWGLGEPVGARIQWELRDAKGKTSKRTAEHRRGGLVPDGPAFPVAGLAGGKDVRWAKTPGGFGYVHVRRCPSDLPERIDEALAAVGDAPGLILDFRANGGGGFDHDAFMGRFVPAGAKLSFAKTYVPAGPRQFAGDVVVIVDAGVRSAGETAAGIFKEDGRGYLIGESSTAGMSSQKTEIALPSGLFTLRVSTASNMGRFAGGKGIEGLGVVPHEITPYLAADLDRGVDTQIRVAEERLKKFPRDKVPYAPPR